MPSVPFASISDAVCRLEDVLLVFGGEFVRRAALTPAALFVALLKAARPLVLGSRPTWGTSSLQPIGHQGHSFSIEGIRPRDVKPNLGPVPQTVNSIE